jgi:hypothetical protein
MSEPPSDGAGEGTRGKVTQVIVMVEGSLKL